jgi:hypothetical protein
MLELAPSDPLIKTYLKDLQHLKSQSVEHELGLKGPFQNLLDKAAKKDDPGYIVRLVSQVVRVSVATAEIVKSLPTFK